MERLPTWVSLFGLSIVIIVAAVDQFPDRGGKENYFLATAIISLIFSFFFIAANLIDRLGNLVVGNSVENAISSLVVALWVVAIAFIQNPKNGAATGINDQGQEYIIYANLYFFSWLNFIAATYLFGNVMRDNFAYNPKFSQWVLLFAASMVLTATSVAVHEDVCEKADQVICGRLKYATSVGSLGIIFTFIAIVSTMMGWMNRILEIGASVLCCVFYFFGVVFLTTAKGPASTLGNMYFSVWGGCFCSFTLLVGAIFPKSENGQENENTRETELDERI